MSRPEIVRPPREAFAPNVWFTLSVGRRQNAEPRWLLPLISSAGGLARGDVGAIRMEQNVTHVEIAADRADAFLAALGSDRTLQDGIRVTPSKGPPAPRPARRGPDARRPAEANEAGAAKGHRSRGQAAHKPGRQPKSRSH